VQAWIDFGRGPLFRLAFALMLLGLARILALSLAAAAEAYRRNADRIVDWKQMAWRTLGWLAPAAHLWRRRPLYGTLSFLFHVGLLSVPAFLGAHILLWRRSIGLAWPALPQALADWLTLLTLVCAAGLLVGRLLDRRARAISRSQDYLWLLLLAAPLASGYACSNLAVSPRAYQWLMLLHVYSANLVMALIPFTKIAHCVLAPLSHLVTALAWKFPAGAGDRVAATLGFAGQPSWIEGARAGVAPTAPARSGEEIYSR